MAPSRLFKSRLFSVLPILIATPYMYYVLNDRFDDHRQRRAVMDEERKKKKAELKAATGKS